MLVLTRHKEERIRIGDSIEITVLEIRRGRVKLGIRCPSEIPVHREEVYQNICAEGPGNTAKQATLVSGNGS